MTLGTGSVLGSVLGSQPRFLGSGGVLGSILRPLALVAPSGSIFSCFHWTWTLHCHRTHRAQGLRVRQAHLSHFGTVSWTLTLYRISLVSPNYYSIYMPKITGLLQRHPIRFNSHLYYQKNLVTARTRSRYLLVSGRAHNH